MKEVTYEDWQKNSTPRMMWVWDHCEKEKVRRKVVYVTKGGPSNYNYPIKVATDDDTDYEAYKHCAEIEKQRRMTNKELSRWLRENSTREWKYKSAGQVYTSLSYNEECANKEAHKDIVIREDDSDWREPLVNE